MDAGTLLDEARGMKVWAPRVAGDMRMMLIAALAACGGGGAGKGPAKPVASHTAPTDQAARPADAGEVDPVKPSVLGDDVAALYAGEIRYLRKGEPVATAPHVIATPKPIGGPAVWQNGELFVGLAGGEVARLMGDKLVVVDVPAKLRKLPKASKNDIKRDHGFDWTHDDGLVAGAKGEVWIAKCNSWYMGDADGCNDHTFIELQPKLQQSQAKGVRAGADLPEWPAPKGFTATQTEESVTCQHGATKLDFKKEYGHPIGFAWITRKPARLAISWLFPDESGEIGDTTEVQLTTDCGEPSHIEHTSSTAGVFAFSTGEGSADTPAPWTVVQDGVEILQFAGAASVVLGGADGEAMIPH
jgi:hypothetical protein